MKALEPGGLAVVGALAGDLEVEPLVQQVLFGGAGVGEAVFFVVGLDEVLIDGARFPEGEFRVRVDDGGQAAVGVDFGGVWGLKGKRGVSLDWWRGVRQWLSTFFTSAKSIMVVS